jgi:hypothetical protein
LDLEKQRGETEQLNKLNGGFREEIEGRDNEITRLSGVVQELMQLEKVKRTIYEEEAGIMVNINYSQLKSY